MDISVALDGSKRRDLVFYPGDEVTVNLIVYAHDGDTDPITVTNVEFVNGWEIGQEFTVPYCFGSRPYRIVGEVDGVITTLVYGIIKGKYTPRVYCGCGPYIPWTMAKVQAINATLQDIGEYYVGLDVEEALQEIGEKFNAYNNNIETVSEAADVAVSAATLATQNATVTLPAYADLRSFLDGVSPAPSGLLYFRKNSATQFEVLTPFLRSGDNLRWRFDNDEAQFNGAVPLDTAQGYTRPFLQTTIVHNRFADVQGDDILASAATASGTPTTSGNYLYLKNIGDSFTFNNVRAKSIRILYNAITNGGTFKVTINGSPVLANLVPKDINGNAIVDSYSATTASTPLMIADNLPDIPLTVRFEVVGKNPASSDTRMYLSNLAGYGALRLFTAYQGNGAPSESVIDTLSLGGSAKDFAISFRPNANSAASTPFIGSVHGYENRTAFELYIDGISVDFGTLAVGSITPVKTQVSFYQTCDIYHPNELTTPANTSERTWTFTREGARLATNWGTWLYDVLPTNGYTQMWTVYGANQGGAGGPLQGWCDRVLFAGCASYPLTQGAAGEFGHHITKDVLFYGTPKNVTTDPGRNAASGNTACLVTINDVVRSFNRFSSSTSRADAIWAQDRSTFRKMYLQSYRGYGVLLAGTPGFTGSMNVQFYKAPRMYEQINDWQ